MSVVKKRDFLRCNVCSQFDVELLNEDGTTSRRGLYADYPAHCVAFRAANQTLFRIPLRHRLRYATAGISLYTYMRE